jgi:hypothetical protein
VSGDGAAQGLEAARLWVRRFEALWVFGLPEERSHAFHSVAVHAISLGRAHFACELAFDRYTTALAAKEMSDQNGDASDDLQAIRLLSAAGDAHHLLVSANLFWRELGALQRDALSDRMRAATGQALAAGGEGREQAKIGRDHIEHLDERVLRGRIERFAGSAGVMTAQTFLQNVLVLEPEAVLFGDERLDLRAIRDTVRAASDALDYEAELRSSVPAGLHVVTVDEWPEEPIPRPDGSIPYAKPGPHTI